MMRDIKGIYDNPQYQVFFRKFPYKEFRNRHKFTINNPESEYIKTYEDVRNDLYHGVVRNAIVSKDEEKRVLHGWGHDKKYFVGSFNDPDGHSRNSLTSNAFYIISNMIQHDPDMKHTY